MRYANSPTDMGSGRGTGSRGFTLVEIMIGLILAGAIGMAALRLLQTQDRFYSHLNHGVNAEQSLRAAADVVSSELRMSVPTDLMAATADSVSIRFDVSQAVVCGTTGGTAQIFVYDSVSNANLSTSLGTAWSGPYSSTYQYNDGWTGSSSQGMGPKTTCTANGTPNIAGTALYRSVTGWSSTVPPRGSIVRRYRQLTYRIAPSTMGNGSALWRGQQEFVGPVDPTSSFAYVMDDGTVQTSVTPGDFSRVVAVRMNLLAVDDDPRLDLTRALQFDIPFRN